MVSKKDLILLPLSSNTLKYEVTADVCGELVFNLINPVPGSLAAVIVEYV